MAEKPKRNGSVVPKKKLAFEYLKSQHFRVVHADGAIGAPTPSGFIHFALYSERFAIPKKQVFEVNESGQLGNLLTEETVAREGMIRELDVDVMVKPDVAESLAIWLLEQVKNARAIEAKSASKRKEVLKGKH